MSVLYIVSSGSEAHKDHGRVIVRKNDNIVANIPLGQVESIVVTSHVDVSMPLIYSFLENGKQISFVDSFGHLKGTLGGEQISLERMEIQKAVFKKDCLYWARCILSEKLKAQYGILKVYAKRKKVRALSDLAGKVRNYRRKLTKYKNVKELRGVEGSASRYYFSGFPYIVDQSLWNWQGRNRRPPRDGLNSLLSFGYTLLERDIRIAAAGAGLDARIGFFHSNNGRKDSLIYDLMEPFRQPVVDRFILKLVNLEVFSPDEFEILEGGCRMKPECRKKWIYEYEEYLETPLQYFQGQTPKQYMRFWIERFGMSIFDSGNISMK